MVELQTQPTKASVAKHLAAIADARRRADAKRIVAMMTRLTRKKPEMWGPGIIGCGRFAYRQDGAEMPLLAFAPRKDRLTLYLSVLGSEKELLAQLGNPPHGKSCLHLKRLDGLNLGALEKLMRASMKKARGLTPGAPIA
jgi:hypothetical protein